MYISTSVHFVLALVLLFTYFALAPGLFILHSPSFAFCSAAGLTAPLAAAASGSHKVLCEQPAHALFDNRYDRITELGKSRKRIGLGERQQQSTGSDGGMLVDELCSIQ